MIARKLKLAPIDGADVLAVLDRRLRELDARRAVITEEIIELEKTSASRPEVSANAAQAEALLDGAEFIASPNVPMSRLSELHAEREVIDRALKLGRSRQHRLATERAGEIWASFFEEIAKIEKRRVMLAFELQRTNRAREMLRAKITEAGGAGVLSTDGVDLLEFGHVHDEVSWSGERLIADGIATRAEIERAKSDG